MIHTKWIFLTIGLVSMAAGIYKSNGFAFGYGVLLLLIAIVEACTRDDASKGGFGA